MLLMLLRGAMTSAPEDPALEGGQDRASPPTDMTSQLPTDPTKDMP
jgi:hypothetical protein